MVPEVLFIDNLQLCQRFSSVRGCVVECGVWRGGMIAAIAHLLGAERDYYLFDSFEGLPQAQDIDGQSAQKWQRDTTSPAYLDNCRTESDFADRAMQLSGAKHYRLVKGWFSDTLPSFKPAEPIAIMRLDADWYSSTLECLENLYRYVAQGGLLIIDDYHTWDGCAKAVHDFLSNHKLSDRVHQSSAGIAYIVKNG
jgi:O-methyltransferase